jgi:hypothetical protein
MLYSPCFSRPILQGTEQFGLRDSVRRKVDVPVLRLGEQRRTTKERGECFADGGCVCHAEGDVASVEDWGSFGRKIEAQKSALLDLVVFVSTQAQSS